MLAVGTLRPVSFASIAKNGESIIRVTSNASIQTGKIETKRISESFSLKKLAASRSKVVR
jgi:hypothetical protein